MQSVIDVKWNGNMSFEAKIADHKIIMDLDEEGGGGNQGPRPKPLMLASLGGCTGIDVITILKKMRIEPDYFNMVIEGDQTEDLPKRYYRIKIWYEFKGDNLPVDKIKKAIDLSHDKYCGVSAVYKKSVELTYEIRILT
jgi:putative redox protein